MTTILAEVTRGGSVESVHAGAIAVADVGGEVVAHAGDSHRFAYFRSSAKPFQAIPVIESGAADAFGITPAELALCCASHAGSARHQAAVRGMLAKLGLDADALRCGAPLPMDDTAAGRVLAGLEPPSPLGCDCSGKHAGMLAVCCHLGYPIETYLEPDHPLQRTIRHLMAGLLRLPEGDLALATDGCSVPTFGAPLSTFALAYATLAAPEQAPAGNGREHAPALDRLRRAMIAHPENVAGEGALVADLMTLTQGKIAAKGGAEGLLCMAAPEAGLGIAIRIADGSFRSHAVIAASVLEQLHLVPPQTITALLERHDPAVMNHNRRHVGDLRSAFHLTMNGSVRAVS